MSPLEFLNAKTSSKTNSSLRSNGTQYTVLMLLRAPNGALQGSALKRRATVVGFGVWGRVSLWGWTPKVG